MKGHSCGNDLHEDVWTIWRRRSVSLVNVNSVVLRYYLVVSKMQGM